MNVHAPLKNPRLDRTRTRSSIAPVSFPLPHRLAPLAGEVELAPVYAKLAEAERREAIDYRGWGGKLGYVATLIGVAVIAALAVIW